MLLLPLPLLTEVLKLEDTSSAAVLVNSLEFCSNVFAVLEFISNICFVVSFACSIVVLNASKLANTKLFVVLNAATLLSATLLMSLLYALAIDS